MSLFDSASLVVTPNGYKEDKLYSIKPTDGSGDLVVTRATTATRVNSDGLIEQVPYNFVTYTEDFNNASWVTVGVTKTTGITDAFGTSKGVRISDIGSGNTSDFIINNAIPMNLSGGDVINYSVYLKGSGTIGLALERGGSGDYFFTTQVVTLTNAWTRYNFSYTLPSGFRNGLQYYITNLTGTTATSVDICFPQITYGTSAKEYFPTTDRLDVPRLDYTNSTCPSILVEPQRTNLNTYSEDFTNGVYTNQNTTISANNTTAPDGTTTADKLVITGSGVTSIHREVTTSSGNYYTTSVYAKKAETQYVNLGFIYSAGIYAGTQFDLNNGTIKRNNSSSYTGLSSTITSVGNGWYRLTVTCIINTATAYPTILPSNAEWTSGEPRQNLTGNNTTGAYFWGLQMELGSYATSYIPTVASSVTRNADVISKTGISSLIGQTEGTIFIEHIYNTEITNPIGADDIVIGFSNGTLNNLLLIIHYGSGVNSYNNKLRLYIRNAGADQALIDLAGTTTGTYKIAVAYKNNDVAFYVNGVQVGIDTSVSVPTLSNLYLYDFLGTNTKYNTDKVKSAAIWKERLSNETLATLTTI